jgi:cytochrome c oxidase accessory protein FixG
LDHIFRRIERWIDGDAMARRALDKAPWTASKIARRVLKHGLYALMAAVIAHLFLAYFVSLERLYDFMHQGPMEHMTAFGIVLFLTLVLWFCFGYFREQFCIIMCPYGRLQSALTDDDTINVGYDEVRGEPRGAKGKAEGDCIDCRRCVQVCPTGIDIRNGLQLECIGCTACIDACDDVMKKINRPTGLIRYDSFNGFGRRAKRFLRPRVYAYCALGLLGFSVMLTVGFYKAKPFLLSISRSGGSSFSSDATCVRNIYKVRVINKLNEPAQITLRLGSSTPQGYILSGGPQTYQMAALAETYRTCVIIAPAEVYRGPGKISLAIDTKPKNLTIEKSVQFLGPDPEVFSTNTSANP